MSTVVSRVQALEAENGRLLAVLEGQGAALKRQGDLLEHLMVVAERLASVEPPNPEPQPEPTMSRPACRAGFPTRRAHRPRGGAVR